MFLRIVAVVLALSIGGDVGAKELDANVAGRLASLALDCVHKAYPNKIAHVLRSDDDARIPRDLTPAF